MPRTEIPVPATFGEAKSKFVASQTLVNCFTEMNRQTGRPAIYGGPGLRLSAAVGAGPIRGLHDFNEQFAICVSGTGLYTQSVRNGAWTLRGAVAGADPVIVANNGFEAVIVAEDASKTYIIDGSALTLAEITDPDFLGASSADFIDQYIAFSKPNTGQWFLSALADAADYDAADVATSESRPDNLRRLLTDNREVLLLGAKTIEGWYNSGAAGFPFDRSTTFVEYGIAGKLAVARLDNTIYFVANDKTVRALRGGNPEIVGDHTIANFLEGLDDLSQIRAFAYSLRGHSFFALRHPDGCLVIDAASGLAHRRQSQNMATWRVGCCETLWGETIMGDADGNSLYALDPDTHSEAGAELTRELVSLTLGPQGAPFTLDALEAEFEVGVGQGTGQGADPKVWLQLSRNSGKTFGARMERRLGAAGQDLLRVVWNGGFGQFPPHGGVFKFGVSDPVQMVLTRAWATFTPDNP